jgi:hypothetical protein
MPTLPKVCPVCASHDIQIVTADSEHVMAVCKSCFARFDVKPYKPPARGGASTTIE